MGNHHTSTKRRAEEELHVVPSKRACFHVINPFECSDSSQKKKRKALTDHGSSSEGKNRIPKLFHSSAKKLDLLLRSGFGEHMRARSQSLVQFQSESNSTAESALSERNQSSNTNVRRKEFPIPWLEALFLPEFPARSSVGEHDFVISNEVGSGSFGRVYRTIAKSNPRGVYAMKIQHKSLILGKNAVQQVRREVAVQRQLSSFVFIARLYASWQTRSKLFTVFQYPIGGIGDMFSLWQEHGVFPEKTVQIYGAELACAIDFLHSHDVIYRDLKLENVTLDSIGHVKLVDFGLAKQLKNGEQTNTVCGTLQYMSPDVASEKPYSHHVDWWSLAVLLHIVVTGKYPYPNAHATHHRHLRFVDYSTPVECTSELGDLFDKMLAFPASRRIRSFSDLRYHRFFLSINFDDVTSLKYNPLHEISNNDKTSFQADIDWNNEESLEDFDENYEFDKFNYFNDVI
ncbi:hypothetical protein KIN20_036296 [Parelaphostrongylus tenuis]|uniref:Protein kinase domain-containing protein n=1 Tax=Parelaphostrongylus tenuis TaxID=148309 RepID=A0AAD5RD05_PARTN|nr:hypothetical protein KIN20_036296 [Parelaphostrongylus tenuis]